MNTTRKTFALAGALTAALLLSASGAMAATPQARNFPQHSAVQQHKPEARKPEAKRPEQFKPQQQAFNNAGKRNDTKAGAHFDKSRIQYVSYDRNAYRDRDHRPPQRADFRGNAPRPGMAFHQGHWHWPGNQWVWIVGTWLIAAQMNH